MCNYRKKLKNKETYYQKRELNRIGLQTFFLNLENNHYDSVNDKIIQKLEKELVDLNLKMNNLSGSEKGDYGMNIYFLEKELFAIAEMKIIYAYKHFETHLKFLIQASYQDVKESKLFKWEFVKEYLRTKKIAINEIDNFQEINELRELNNSIKHSRNIINDKTKNIRELGGKTKLTYMSLINFYNRIENSPYKFILSLSDKIDKDLYEFDDKRLDEIKDKLAIRMNNETIEKLIKKLKSIK